MVGEGNLSRRKEQENLIYKPSEKADKKENRKFNDA